MWKITQASWPHSVAEQEWAQARRALRSLALGGVRSWLRTLWECREEEALALLKNAYYKALVFCVGVLLPSTSEFQIQDTGLKLRNYVITVTCVSSVFLFFLNFTTLYKWCVWNGSLLVASWIRPLQWLPSLLGNPPGFKVRPASYFAFQGCGRQVISLPFFSSTLHLVTHWDRLLHPLIPWQTPVLTQRVPCESAKSPASLSGPGLPPSVGLSGPGCRGNHRLALQLVLWRQDDCLTR